MPLVSKTPRRVKVCRHDRPGAFRCWIQNIGDGSIWVCGKCNAKFVRVYEASWADSFWYWKRLEQGV